MGFCLFFKEQKPVFLKKTTKHPDLKRNEKTLVGWGLKKTSFSQTWLSFNTFFCDFPLIARSGTSHITNSLIGYAPNT